MATAEQLLQQARQYHQQGQLQTALDLYRAAVKASPRLADAHTALGQALIQAGLDAEAVEHLERAVKLEPTSAQALCNLGAAHRGQGRLDLALQCFERAGWLQKQFPRAVGGAAEIHLLRGQHGKAYTLLLPYIQVQQDTPPLTLNYARCCRFLGKENEAAPALARQLAGASGDLPPILRMNLTLELARCADTLGHPDRAFAAATDANRILGRRFPAKEYVEAIESVIANWTPEAHAQLPKAAAESDLPVLLVGMPRCGAALVEQILSSHADIAPTGETALSRHIVQRLEGGPSPFIKPFTNSAALSYQLVNEMAGFYVNTLQMIAKSQGAETPKRITDRCTHNYLYLGLLDRIIPKGRVIHIKRNPLDMQLSTYMTAFDIPYLFKTHPADFAVAYKAYERLMNHWKSVIGLPILEVNYEDIVSDLEGQARKMVEFLGLDWDPACLRFWETPRKFTSIQNQGILKPIYTTSVGRHKNYEQFVAPLRAALGMPAAEGTPAPQPGQP
ncbi:MAG: sulfotransferase [Phycisphaerales bacterium]|nr:sulfotransferase [Phycisphaerales bacterium]